ncbi:MAG: hypothetical protein IJF03_07270 [Lachnospiraceae bacterium]|nr:hypothetical protein [Lachnospiraceae bacterium]
MKEVLEEYGGIIIAIVAVGVLVGYLPKLKWVYVTVGKVFLDSIGG